MWSCIYNVIVRARVCGTVATRTSLTLFYVSVNAHTVLPTYSCHCVYIQIHSIDVQNCVGCSFNYAKQAGETKQYGVAIMLHSCIVLGDWFVSWLGRQLPWMRFFIRSLLSLVNSSIGPPPLLPDSFCFIIISHPLAGSQNKPRQRRKKEKRNKK